MCEFCSDSFVDLTKEDNYPEDISENYFYSLAGDKFSIRNYIDEYGKLCVSTSSHDNRVLTSEKIRYCPMCGAEIPEITPTERSEISKK